MEGLDRTDTTDLTQDTEGDYAETVSREELEVFNEYLTSVSSALLDIESQDYFHKFIHTEENFNIIKSFVTDKQYRVLYVSKIEEFSKPIGGAEGDGASALDKTQDEEGGQDVSKSKSMMSIVLDLKITYRGGDTQSVAFIKRQQVTNVALKEARRGIGKQLQVINLGYVGEENDLFRIANIYVDDGLIPLFSSYKTMRSTEESSFGHIDEIEQLLAKLRLEFIHCTQDQMFYDVKLIVPQRINEKADKAKAEGRDIKEEDFEAELKDPAFFDSLKKCLQSWTKDISKVTYTRTDFAIDSVLTEISFWKNRENALSNIEEQLESDKVKMVFDLLQKDSAMSSVVFSFKQNINVVNEKKMAQEFNHVLKDCPINALISANDLKSIHKSIIDIFSFFKIFKSVGSYPLKRVLDLLEAASRDMSKRVLKILEEVELMTIESKQFEIIKEECLKIFNDFDKNMKDFIESIKSKYPKRTDKKLLTKKFDMEHNAIQHRINEITNQRRENEKLLEIVSSVFSGQEEGDAKNRQAIKDIKDAYMVFLAINVLNMNIEGEKKWNKAKKEYNFKIDRVEEEITSQMRDRLATAKSTNEMFRTFSKFNALFSRPRIRGAIQEYQNQILSSIKKDIKNFRDTVSVKYHLTQGHKMNKYRKLPYLSGLLTWYNQLERKLQKYLGRIHDVLGAGWEKHTAGKQLKSQIDPIQKHLSDIKESHYNTWIKEMSELNSFNKKDGTLQIFKIITKSDGNLKLEVNFSEKRLSIFREKAILKSMGYTLPYTVIMKSQEVQLCYPKYISLVDTLATFNQVETMIIPEIAMLLASKRIKVHNKLKQGAKITWTDDRGLDSYCNQISVQMQDLEDATHDVLEKNEKLKLLMNRMHSCDFSEDEFKNIMEEIQGITDDYIFNDYSNIAKWVSLVNAEIQKILIQRAETTIEEWLEEFDNYGETTAKLITMAPIHEIKIRDQQLVMDPSVQEMRSYWYKQLNGIVTIICGQKRIESMKYEKGSRAKNALTTDDVEEVPTFKSALKAINPEILLKANRRIEASIKDASSYVSISGCQALWNVDFTKLYEKLEADVPQWHKVLSGLKKLIKRNFDSAETIKHFGAVVIDYQKAQDQVNNRFNTLQDQIIKKLYEDLNTNMGEFVKTLRKAKSDLEVVSLENPNIDVTTFITEIQDKSRLSQKWEKDLANTYEAGVNILKKKYTVQNNQNLNIIDQVRGAWNNFTQILKKKSKSMEEEMDKLKESVLKEEVEVKKKIEVAKKEWVAMKEVGFVAKKDDKEVDDDAMPDIQGILNFLSIMESKGTKLKNAWKRVCKAKELLDMDLSDPEALDGFEETILDHKEVWSALGKIWGQVIEIGEIQFNSLNPKKVKEELRAIVESLLELPTKLKQYDAYEDMKARVSRFQSMQNTIIDLKGEAMKQRHWTKLLRQLRIKVPFNDLTLNDLWASDLIANKVAVSDIMAQAVGENAIERFLTDIKEHWSTHELDLIKYQTKCRLIRGWDDLFTMIDEDLANLQSTRMSPFVKNFEEEISKWDEKLEEMRIIFDVWIDVQRRWVYLEGIFFGSADIKTQLPQEFSRFKSIDSEFISLMKQVSAKPLTQEVYGIANLQKTLQRLSDMLNKVQKALGDYLETQRSNFARFYFVGDEDLLEIIGNAKDITNIQRHFAKMFAGIAILKSEDGNELEGMYSREGEYVNFKEKVRMSDDNTIYTRLTKIESMMQNSLAHELEKSVDSLEIIDSTKQEVFLEWIESYPAQIVLTAMQISWANRVEDALKKSKKTMVGNEESIGKFLVILAERVLTELPKDIRQKYEQLITDLVHQRDTTRHLIEKQAASVEDFSWLYHMRYYWVSKEKDALKKVQILMANAVFNYGFEYLGVGEKLVQTPLTDRCYLTLTQALHFRLGGNPFGPAGTGKTESVKALGAQLGRFVLVFNCDETFDGNAMARIFVGLCQVGAWGCFDEFNRLEERMLSAVSQQILTIQTGLQEHSNKIDLHGSSIKLNPAMGIFVTMNPGYAGRSNLPDNLKQLFRQVAMIKPNREMIARVMLYSQGYKTAEKLSGKIVSLFELCGDQLSSQPHYDFGLRALKSVLVTAGNLMRAEREKNEEIKDEAESEQGILIRSVCNTVVPKLVAEDIPLLSKLLGGVFPGSDIIKVEEVELIDCIKELLNTRFNLMYDDAFISKVLQLMLIQTLHHGIMMVGPTGSGKTSAYKLLSDCIMKVRNTKIDVYVIEPKSITKDDLYGRLDPTTGEWTDGVFTGILRRILDNVRGESQRTHWIIFDGDVDPEWAENLNSVLDDNKLFTLPSGERLSIPANVKIMFEVQDLKNATLATVSRCGMVWFSQEIVTLDMIYFHYLERLKQQKYESLIREDALDENEQPQIAGIQVDENKKQNKKTREVCVESIKRLFMKDGFVTQCLEYSIRQKHVMKFTYIRALEALFALIRKGIVAVLEYNEERSEFPLSESQIEAYMTKWVVSSCIWGIGGSQNLAGRIEFCLKIHEFSDVQLPDVSGPPLIDYEVRVDDQEWHLWKERVPRIDVEVDKVTAADTVITTVDTIRHQEMLCSWLSQRVPFILCGPPGSGKTMTLISTLNALTDCQMIFVNFSSSTTPELILRSFDQYCEYKKTTKNEMMLLRPKQANKWLIVFCDEINLPEPDQYGTQKVISFLRQLTEQNGFYRPQDKSWVTLERIQFVGACNPPTDQGRHPMTDRFMRHYPLILVDFPGEESLKQIYSTFNRAMMKTIPALANYAEPLTEAMVEFYEESQKRFTADQQPHYVYSPRELTRWKLAIYEALDGLETLEDLVRLYVHEALRLFEDRLVTQEEKDWCNETINVTAQKWFPSADLDTALQRPILFSEYLTRVYKSVEQEEIRKFIQGKLYTFNEEELDVPLVVFDSVVDHILRIDRVLKQPLGHLLLVGASGVGKTTLARFVAWINSQTVFQIKAGRNYSLENFDEDIKHVMRRSGVKGEKICFIFDESNVLSAAFLERMNALLASGEVPGLFEGDDYTHLINQCKENSQKLADSEEELYNNFVKEVQRNLHVVFTMNPANPDFSNRTASSPALFNRCVIDWFGEWVDESLWQVAREFTKDIELMDESFENYEHQETVGEDDTDPKHEALISSIAGIHKSVKQANVKLAKNAKKYNFITPRDYLDFIKHFTDVLTSKKEELLEQELHLNTGLDKLKETEAEVIDLSQNVLVKIQADLEVKNDEANKKLTLMVEEQNNAEKSREVSIKTSEEVKIMSVEIAKRKEEVDKDLGKAEPALNEAQKSVNSIKTSHLNEMKAMGKPPDKVRYAMEAVCVLIYGLSSKPEWREVIGYIKKTDFIPTILSFNKDDVTNKTKKFIMKEYLEKKEWDLDAIDKASKAAGPLAKWVTSLIEYAEIFLKIEPLRNEVRELEEKESELSEKSIELNNKIEELEKNIGQYKKDYAVLIAEVERIKTEMDKVKNKVDRSKHLIGNLSSERTRWEFSCQDIKNQMATIIGDCLLSGAFLTYLGFFDHSYRILLNQEWKSILVTSGIKYKEDIAYLEFLSKPSERLQWQSEGLPNDDICLENATIFKYYNRYPLVIDPSEQANSFILKHYEDSKIQKTSFVDDAFMKQLESSIRFGYPLLVQDVEKYDPILNSVLNKEIHKTNGRVLIRVGDQDIDFSPSFKMFMITRDSQAQFTPDLCSRVTFCNFTVTPSSLQSQCLNIYLKNERPEIEKKRQDLLKLQGECKVLLRELEDKLLNTLSTFEGSILENDQLISTLETIKKEAMEIQKKVDATDETINEIELVSEVYQPLSVMTSRIYFTLENMPTIHYLYQFSLEHYMDTIFELIRENKDLNAIPKTDPDTRLKKMFDMIYRVIFQQFSSSLLYEDKILFALRLAQIRMENRGMDEFEMLMKTPTIMELSISSSLVGGSLSDNQLAYIQYLGTQKEFTYLIDHMETNEDTWKQFMKDPVAENNVPELPGDDELQNDNPLILKLRKLILIKILRPDRFANSLKDFIHSTLENNILDEDEMNFSTAVEEKSNAKSPLLLVSAPGYDASAAVEEIAKSLNKKLFSIAIGAAECYDIAEKNITSASKIGGWVLLKNVHLAPGWLVDVEKKLHKLAHHKSFRIFMTMEFNPKIPTTLLRMSMIFVFEPPSGIKASLMRTYGGIVNAQRSEKPPKERCRMHFLLSWFHAVIQERLRFTPIGWSKKYEFNESDQRGSLDAVDEWVSRATKEMSDNIDPRNIPWDAIQVLLSETIYGGKVDNEYDQKILNSLTEQFFTPASFDDNFALFKVPSSSDVQPLIVPNGKKVSDYKKWIEELPNVESPLWCGLPVNVDNILKKRLVLQTIENFKLLQGVEDEEASGVEAGDQEKGALWLQKLNDTVSSLLGFLPEAMPSLERKEESLTDPLFRFLEREVFLGRKLLEKVREDLTNLKLMSTGEIKVTNDLRELSKELDTDSIPKRWKLYKVANITATEWVIDFVKRLAQLKDLAEEPEYKDKKLWIGGFFFPEALITATRQSVAGNHGWSLEELDLIVQIGKEEIENDQCFVINNFTLEGYEWSQDQNDVQASDVLSAKLPPTTLKWVRKEEELKAQDQSKVTQIPVYLNNERLNLLFSVKIISEQPRTELYQRGIALVAWSTG